MHGPPPPRAPRFLTEDERQWLAQLRQLTCPGTKYWVDHLFGIRDAYGNYPDDYWPYVSHLNTWYEGTFPCNKAESGMKRPKASVISTGWRPKDAHPVVIEWTL